MSSIIRTIDSISSFRIGDYVQFNNDKVGYIKEVLNNGFVKIQEAGEESSNRLYRIRNVDCKVIPLAGHDPSKNRNIIQ